MVVSCFNAKQACAGTIQKWGPFNKTKMSKCKQTCMVAAVGVWVAFSEWGTLNLWEIEQEKASTLWPQVICTSRVTSVGPLGCHTMQGILDLFTPHLASKATTTGGGRRRVKYWNHGTSCRLEPWRENSASFLNSGTRSAYSHLNCMLMMGRQANQK